MGAPRFARSSLLSCTYVMSCAYRQVQQYTSVSVPPMRCWHCSYNLEDSVISSVTKVLVERTCQNTSCCTLSLQKYFQLEFSVKI